jgi:hypothetical protein
MTNFGQIWETIVDPEGWFMKDVNPTLAGDSLLRLGGRLRNAALGYSEEHSVIQPAIVLLFFLVLFSVPLL